MTAAAAVDVNGAAVRAQYRKKPTKDVVDGANRQTRVDPPPTAMTTTTDTAAVVVDSAAAAAAECYYNERTECSASKRDFPQTSETCPRD